MRFDNSTHLLIFRATFVICQLLAALKADTDLSTGDFEQQSDGLKSDYKNTGYFGPTANNTG